jgi:hypothetical protein
MDKAFMKEIREGKKKEKKEKRAKRVIYLGIVANRTTIKIVEKCVKAQFIVAWILIVVKEVDDRFH